MKETMNDTNLMNSIRLLGECSRWFKIDDLAGDHRRHAENYEDARKEAAENFHCYNNQHLELVAEADADAEDWNDAIENEAARQRDSFQA